MQMARVEDQLMKRMNHETIINAVGFVVWTDVWLIVGRV